MPGPVILRVHRLRAGYPLRSGGVRTVVREASFTLRAGETLCLMGPNGAGKTTLALALLRLLPVLSGEIHCLGRDLLKLPPRELRRLRRDLQLVFQEPERTLRPGRTVAQLLRQGLRAHGLPAPPDRLARALRNVGLPPAFADRRIETLSGGERRRVAWARALVLDPRILILDEPLAGLDPPLQVELLELLRRLSAAGTRAFLVITHRPAVARYLGARAACLWAGRLRLLRPVRAEDTFTAP